MNISLSILAAIFTFGLGYGFRYFTLKYESSISDVVHERTLEFSQSKQSAIPSSSAAAMHILKALLAELSAAELSKFKHQFRLDMSECLTQLLQACESGDMDLADYASHTIKGLAATYGYAGLSESADLTNLKCKIGMETDWKDKARATHRIGCQVLDDLDSVFDQIYVAT